MKGNIAEILKSCKKEEEVKSEVAKWLGFQINALGDIDHYSDSILFEFKYDKGFEKKENIAKVLGPSGELEVPLFSGYGYYMVYENGGWKIVDYGY